MGCLGTHLGSLAAAEETLLLLRSLEATVAEFGGGIDELEGDLLQSGTGLLGEEGLAESEDATLGADDATLQDQELLVNDTVVREAAHGGDGLLGEIGVGGGVVLVLLKRLTDTVDLLVHLGAVMVTVLTSSGHLELDTGRMPSTNTGDLAETTMTFAGKAGSAPTGGDTFVTLTLGDADNIDALVHVENGVDGDGLLEEFGAEIDLIGNGTTIDLDLEDVSPLLALELGLANLGVADSANDGAIFLHLLEFGGHLAIVFVLGFVAGEGLALGLVPILVETALALLGEMLGPDGGQGTKTRGGLDVTDDTDDNHGGSFDDGDGLGDLLLVVAGAGLVQITGDVGHAGLESHETGQMAWLILIILGESLDLALVVLGTLAGQESQRTVAGSFKLTMRHLSI